MSLTTATVTRTNDIKYSTAALVSGVSVSATLTRDYDIYTPYASISVTTTAQTFYTPTSGQSGTAYVMLYDGTYYAYQQFTYDARLTITQITANKLLSNVSAKTSTITTASGRLKIAISSGTGTAKIRLNIVKS